MGGMFSIFRRNREVDYEQVLADLDEKIQKAQANLAAIRLREKKWVVVFLVYSIFAYILYTLAFYFYFNHGQHPLNVWAYKAAPVAIGPFTIYYIRKLIQLWFRRRQASEEAYIVTLTEKQRAKVEELKKKTSYYTTKTLLERYDSDKRAGNSGKKVPRGPASPAATMPGNRPPASSPASQLRHRQPGPGHIGPTAARNDEIPRRSLSPSAQRSGSMLSQPGPALRPPPGVRPLPAPQSLPANRTPQSRPWFDKLVDKIVGDEGPETKYALVCRNCFAHNGLALPEEIRTIQYICPKCGYFNGRSGTKPPSPPGTAQQPPRPLCLSLQGNGGSSTELRNKEHLSDPEADRQSRRRAMSLRTSQPSSVAPLSPQGQPTLPCSDSESEFSSESVSTASSLTPPTPVAGSDVQGDSSPDSPTVEATGVEPSKEPSLPLEPPVPTSPLVSAPKGDHEADLTEQQPTPEPESAAEASSYTTSSRRKATRKRRSKKQ